MNNATCELQECGAVRAVVATAPGVPRVSVQRVTANGDFPGKVEIFIGEGPTIRLLVMTLDEGAMLQEAFARLG